MIQTHFQEHDFWLLIPSLLLIVASIFLCINQKYKLSILLLTIGGLGLFFFMAQLDPLLWDWDEKFHALVAQHLLSHPFRPTLLENPVSPVDFKAWYNNHIWLHKPPMTLWQIALCLKIFGNSELSVRIPSVFIATLLIPVIYRMGSIALDKRTGYIAALLWTVNWYTLTVVSGYEGMGGVDITFTFYIMLSFWSWIEYKNSNKKIFLILIGVFSGFAVLTKFVVGLLIFAAWTVSITLSKEDRKKRSTYTDVLISLLISAIIFVPWQIYIFKVFPVEAGYESEFSRRHFFEVIEEHGGDAWYYLYNLAYTIGKASVFFVVPAIYCLYKGIQRFNIRIFILAGIIIPFAFFSMAATKLSAFCFIVSPLLFIAFGSLLDRSFVAVENAFVSILFKWAAPVILVLVCYFSMNFNRIEFMHTDVDPIYVYRINKVLYTKYYKKLPQIFGDRNIVFGNPCPDCGVEMMFYAPGSTIYSSYPDSVLYFKLKRDGYKMAAYTSDNMPPFLKRDSTLRKVEFKLK